MNIIKTDDFEFLYMASKETEIRMEEKMLERDNQYKNLGTQYAESYCQCT
jgi:hypothetical protein